MRRQSARPADRRWRGNARSAVACALTFLTLAIVLDDGAGTLTIARAGLWTVLAAVVLTVLLPSRVTAGEGWLAVRGPLRERRVRSDALVTVRQHDGVSGHLVLRDADGRWLELDPRVLAANPLLLHQLDADVRRSRERGTLRSGEELLRQLSEQIDDTRAQAVFRASGLK